MTENITIVDPAMPLLRQAHSLMWQVRAICADDEMIAVLSVSLEKNREAQSRLNRIAGEAKSS